MSDTEREAQADTERNCEVQSDELAGESTIILDRARVLKFNNRAMRRFQEASGESIIEVWMVGLHGGFGHKQVTYLLWAGLIHDDRSLTVEDVDDLIDNARGDGLAEKLNSVMKPVTEAFNLAYFGKKKRLPPKKEDLEAARKLLETIGSRRSGLLSAR